ncbi:hypothetical protein [Alysiella filiformis]|uniref:Uncharacterized protein n=1 Tax=Alysiella filiformis DSM 16848 TaxID=1120981 RepID=A0A286E6W4_9NEIS|nr:hypothetical protein [Alysiella filiformis]QMT31544.1 hypothetical protein H3L97_01135 [Alysiella filiformis]UBQ55443.1 hypothetical protein JF568_07540 [Alysiella filiformis DSM 16848]SOD66658.1 hypothetical protein SAMN02746062_00682 [Alysiella filiformis DSM 16848]
MLNLSHKQRKWLMYGNVVLAMILLIAPFYRYERWYFAVIMSGLNGGFYLSVGLALYFAEHKNRLSAKQWQYLLGLILAISILGTLGQIFLPRN